MNSQDGSSNDQVGLTSEVASVIREFTEPDVEDGDKYSNGKLNGDPVRYVTFGFFSSRLVIN